MKNLLTLFVLIPLLSFNSAKTDIDVVGKWTGEDHGEIGTIIFDKDGYASIEIQGQVMGGKEFMMNGQKGKMVYTINKDLEPIEIDFIITKIKSGETMKLLFIAKFVDNDTMILASSFKDGKRPTHFTNENSITLIREK